MSATKSNPLISVIIVNYKSWSHLKNCLNSLNFERSDFNLEIIVVDNQSNDGKLGEFREEFSHVKFVVNSGNNGFANANNLGFKNSNGKFLLFLNPDTVVNKESIGNIFFYANNNPSVGIVSCLQRKTSGGFEKSVRLFPSFLTLFGFTRAIYRLLSHQKEITDKNVVTTDWVSGSVVFMTKEWFEQIGGWNEDYWMYYEDIDLSKRVTNANGRVVILMNVEILHNHGGSSRINMKTASLTKTEVLISKHVYIQNHFKGVEKTVSQTLLVFYNLISKFILGLFGILLFFIPKMRLNVYLFTKISRYYLEVMIRRSWLSPNSMNLKN